MIDRLFGSSTFNVHKLESITDLHCWKTWLVVCWSSSAEKPLKKYRTNPILGQGYFFKPKERLRWIPIENRRSTKRTKRMKLKYVSFRVEFHLSFDRFFLFEHTRWYDETFLNWLQVSFILSMIWFSNSVSLIETKNWKSACMIQLKFSFDTLNKWSLERLVTFSIHFSLYIWVYFLAPRSIHTEPYNPTPKAVRSKPSLHKKSSFSIYRYYYKTNMLLHYIFFSFLVFTFSFAFVKLKYRIHSIYRYEIGKPEAKPINVKLHAYSVNLSNSFEIHFEYLCKRANSRYSIQFHL